MYTNWVHSYQKSCFIEWYSPRILVCEVKMIETTNVWHGKLTFTPWKRRNKEKHSTSNTLTCTRIPISMFSSCTKNRLHLAFTILGPHYHFTRKKDKAAALSFKSLCLKNSSKSCALPWAYYHMPLENVTSKSHNNSLVSELYLIILLTNCSSYITCCCAIFQVFIQDSSNQYF